MKYLIYESDKEKIEIDNFRFEDFNLVNYNPHP